MRTIACFALAVSLLVSSCCSTHHKERGTPGRWQVAIGPGGQYVLTDTVTGDTWVSQLDHGTYRWQPILPALVAMAPDQARATTNASEQTLTLDRAVWWDDPTWSPEIREMLKSNPMLLLHVANSPDYSTTFKPFTQLADPDFSFQEHGLSKLSLKASSGGVTLGPEVYVVLRVQQRDLDELEPGAEYTLNPANSHPGFRWQVTPTLRVIRR